MSIDAKAAYRQTAGGTANSVRIVVLLYEQLVEDVRRALKAAEQRDAEICTLEIDHALEVINHLQGRLDMERGGDVARNLECFYDLLRVSLLQANIQSSCEVLRKQLDNLLTLREAWLEVERVEAVRTASPVPTAAPAAASTPPGKPLNWSA